jgi:histidine ammonia-lyase
MAITVMGEGYVLDFPRRARADQERAAGKGHRPLKLKYKEGLSLINGTRR